MSDSRFSPGRLEWLPIITAGVAIASTVAFSNFLATRDTAHLERRTEAEAHHIAAQLQEGVKSRLDNLQRIGNWWLSQGRPLESAEWEQDLDIFLNVPGGLKKVIWINRNNTSSWSVVPRISPKIGQRPVPEELQLLAAEAEKWNSLEISLVRMNDKPAAYACFPIFRKGSLEGFVVGFYDLRELLDSVLQSQLPQDYQVKILAAGQEIYSTRLPGMEPMSDVTRTVDFSIGRSKWSAQIALSAASGAGQPRLIMSFGVIVAILLYLITALGLKSRRRAADLRRANADFETLFDVTPVGIAIAGNAACTNIWMNPALARMMDVADVPNTSKSGPDEGKLPFRISRNGRDVPAEQSPMQTAARTGKEVRADELDIVRADGRVVNALSFAAPLFDQSGKVRGVVNAWVDITERKRNEEERARLLLLEKAARAEADKNLAALQASEATMNRLIDSVVIGVVIADRTRIIEANQYCLDMIGYAKWELTDGGIPWTALTPPDRLADEERRFRDLCSRGTLAAFERDLVTKSGRVVPVLVGGTVLDRSSNENGRFILFVLDLTRRLELEQRLQRAEKLKSLALMAGGVAHDFNNLLTVVLGNAALAIEKLPPNAEEHRLISAVLTATNRAAELVSQILAYTGRAYRQAGPLDLSNLVLETYESIRRMAPENVDIRLDLGEDLPRFRGNGIDVQQLVKNLAANAIEALGSDGGAMTIRTSTCEMTGAVAAIVLPDLEVRAGSYVRLEVIDTGCGMPEEVAARAFDPFFTTKFTGRGLGLSVVQGIVRAHHGGIRVQSSVGYGTQVEIIFPACDQPSRPEGEVAVLAGQSR